MNHINRVLVQHIDERRLPLVVNKGGSAERSIGSRNAKYIVFTDYHLWLQTKVKYLADNKILKLEACAKQSKGLLVMDCDVAVKMEPTENK